MSFSGTKRGPRSFVGRTLLVCAALISGCLATVADARREQPQSELNYLLERAAEYCDKLSRSVLDFVCRERIEEWFYPGAGPSSSWRKRRAIFVGRRETRALTYDYQLVRDRAASIRENRTLLKENRKDVQIPDSPLKTSFFWHAFVVMGPLGLLSRDRQADHDYGLVREEKVGGEPAYVIEAVPKPGVRSDHLVGTIWLRSRDAGILKIEWNPSSIDNYAGVEATGKRLEMTPHVIMTSEYAFEKNGIRFPSRYTVKETYVRGGRHFQRSQTDVLYDRYKFFTVETQVKF